METSALKLFTSCLTYCILLLLSIAVPWSIFGPESLPGSSGFGLVILFDVCILSGKLIHSIPLPKLPPLPPLLGMVLAGIALRNIPYINVAKDIIPFWSTVLRSIALVVILVKAGLELDAKSLKTMKGVCMRLTVIPCIVEAMTCCLVSYLILGFSWKWGLLMGFVLGAVTPAVIVPCLLLLQKQRYGVEKGIPSLVIAASSFDDVLAITGFSVVLGITFSSQNSFPNISDSNSTVATLLNTTSTTLPSTYPNVESSAGEIALLIVRGPLEMVGGIIVGVALGIVMWYIPNGIEKHVHRNRTLFIFGFGIMAVFGSRRAGVPGSGALAAIVTPFVSAYRWNEEKNQVSDAMGKLWALFEPLLFGLIGAEISFADMDSNTIGGGIAVLLICLCVRALATYSSVLCSELDLKERIFICIAWIPKATVQAAIGPIALDTARERGASYDVQQVAQQVLTITVLCILITAPLGAAAITLSGPKLLHQAKNVAVTETMRDEQTHSGTALVGQTSKPEFQPDQIFNDDL